PYTGVPDSRPGCRGNRETPHPSSLQSRAVSQNHEVRKNSVICKWDPPLDDGGSEILNYTLEKKDNSKLEFGWSCVTSTLRGCRYLVPKLIEKKEYIFRVVAENKFGPGPSVLPLNLKRPRLQSVRKGFQTLPREDILVS
uniref:Fibronectin type-III domain-containing protein n=1 Tax=Cyprinodon variegatus TaxID=28743 RepID=A0A3Q2DZP7_CYPVA